jgi:hypothetical protein
MDWWWSIRSFGTCLGVVLLVASPTMSKERSMTEDIGLIDALFSANEKFVELKGHQKAENLTILGFQLAKHTLEDARKKLGPTRSIDAPHHSYPFVCYRSLHQGDETVLVLNFDDHEEPPLLAGYQIIAGTERFKVRGRCARSRLVSKTLATESGAKLGMGREEITRIWGVPITNEQRDHIGIDYNGYAERHNGGVRCVNVFSRVGARFVDSRLTWLDVSVGGELIRQDRCTEEELSVLER